MQRAIRRVQGRRPWLAVDHLDVALFDERGDVGQVEGQERLDDPRRQPARLVASFEEGDDDRLGHVLQRVDREHVGGRDDGTQAVELKRLRSVLGCAAGRRGRVIFGVRVNEVHEMRETRGRFLR
jgi:hypothetical protein